MKKIFITLWFLALLIFGGCSGKVCFGQTHKFQIGTSSWVVIDGQRYNRSLIQTNYSYTTSKHDTTISVIFGGGTPIISSTSYKSIYLVDSSSYFGNGIKLRNWCDSFMEVK